MTYRILPAQVSVEDWGKVIKIWKALDCTWEKAVRVFHSEMFAQSYNIEEVRR